MKFIYDRTQADVDYAKQNPDSKEFLKGALNYTDLDRIEQNYINLANKLELIGKNVTINPVKSYIATLYQELLDNYSTYADIPDVTYEELLNEDKWKMTDLIFLDYINQIRDNVKAFKEALNIKDTIEYTNSLNYKQLNILEKILYEVYIYIEESMKTFEYSGTFYCGEENIAY